MPFPYRSVSVPGFVLVPRGTAEATFVGRGPHIEKMCESGAA